MAGNLNPEHRNLIVEKEALEYAVRHWIETARDSILKRGSFHVALSGGSTPKAIYQRLSQFPDVLDWSKVYLYWSDERCVSPTHPDSNFKMAMDAGFSKLPIPHNQIFRMKGEGVPVENALSYDAVLPSSLDLVMLGMGDDGHTASLFPETEALHVSNTLCATNYVPKLHTWRLTLTYPAINNSKTIAIYVLGESKAEMIKKVFTGPYDPNLLPIQKIGTSSHPANWILDPPAAQLII